MSSSFRVRDQVVRADETHLAIAHPDGVPMTLLAGVDVPIEDDAIVQAVHFGRLAGTLDDLWRRQRRGAIAPYWGDQPGRLEQIVLTPDLHKGSGIPGSGSVSGGSARGQGPASGRVAGVTLGPTFRLIPSRRSPKLPIM
jgi:hypothetical protein